MISRAARQAETEANLIEASAWNADLKKFMFMQIVNFLIWNKSK